MATTKKKTEPETIAETVNTIPVTAIVNVTKLNVRKSADVNSEIIRVASEGEVIVLKSEKETNGFVELENGFVMSKFITIAE